MNECHFMNFLSPLTPPLQCPASGLQSSVRIQKEKIKMVWQYEIDLGHQSQIEIAIEEISPTRPFFP